MIWEILECRSGKYWNTLIFFPPFLSPQLSAWVSSVPCIHPRHSGVMRINALSKHLPECRILFYMHSCCQAIDIAPCLMFFLPLAFLLSVIFVLFLFNGGVFGPGVADSNDRVAFVFVLVLAIGTLPFQLSCPLLQESVLHLLPFIVASSYMLFNHPNFT